MDNSNIATLAAASAVILAATVIYLKSKSSPFLIKTASRDSGDEAISDETPNLRYMSADELEDLYDSLEEDSFRNPSGEDDGDYCARLRSIVLDLETIVLHSTKVHFGEIRLRDNKELQKRIATLLSLRRRILDQIFFMAANREEHLALESFNRDVMELEEVKGQQIMPMAGVDTCRCFISDGYYSSNFAILQIVLSVMKPEYYEDIYSDFVYADSSLEPFEGMNLSDSIIELHRRLYSIADLARIKIQTLTKNTKRNNGSKNTHIS